MWRYLQIELSSPLLPIAIKYGWEIYGYSEFNYLSIPKYVELRKPKKGQNERN